MRKLLTLAALAALLGSASMATDAKAGNTSCLPVPSHEPLIKANQDKLREGLKDPYSAVFSGTYINCKSGAPVVCGFVNAKNAYGAFIGRQRWIGVLYNASTEEGLGLSFTAFWERTCSQ